MSTATSFTNLVQPVPTESLSDITADITSAAPSEITPAPSSSSDASESSDSSSSSSSRPPQVHTVKAGAGGFKFEPAELKDVNVGDTVTFEFYPPDHSVARADFGSACVPYEYVGANREDKGFWSETQWVKNTKELTYFNVTIDTTEPIFYYCAAPASCTDQNMVGVINPNATQTLDKQIISAKEAQFQVAPGEPIPAEGTASLHGGPTGTPAASSGSHGVHLSGGAIAGIVVGGVAFLVICAALFFYVGRTKSLREVIKDKETAKSPNPDQSPFPGSPGFAPAPFSPNMGHAEHGGQLPAYGQHNATDAHFSGVYSPVPQHAEMAEVKYGHQEPPAELASPTPGQQAFTAELEAPHHKHTASR